jgi:hypothetical protein
MKQMPPGRLLKDIEKGRFGEYYQIWYALMGRTDVRQAGKALLRVLRSRADDLNRYHCAVLLLSLYNPDPEAFSPVTLTNRGRFDAEAYLNRYEQLMSAKLSAEDSQFI